jgi:pimeloyl-ACP methyl ester carboxylesterase
MRWLLVVCVLIPVAGAAGAESTPSADGVAISYEVLGRGEPAVILIHGWSCDRGYWRHQTAALAEKHLVVAVDLAGHGASATGRTDYTMAAFGADVAAVADHLKLEKVILVGHSMGGTVAVHAAGLLPGRVQGVVGIDTLHEVGFGFTPEAVDAFLTPMHTDFAAFTDRFVRAMFPRTADPRLVAEVAGDMSAADPEVARSSMHNLLLNDLKGALEKITVPIVCLDSPVRQANLEAWEFYQPGYEVVIMDGVGHFPMLEKPDAFTVKLGEVLARF